MVNVQHSQTVSCCNQLYTQPEFFFSKYSSMSLSCLNENDWPVWAGWGSERASHTPLPWPQLLGNPVKLATCWRTARLQTQTRDGPSVKPRWESQPRCLAAVVEGHLLPSSSLQISISSSASLSLQQSEMSHSQICSHHFPALNRRKCQSAHRVVAASCSSLRGCKLSRWWLGCVIMSGSRRNLVERWSYI